jgi:hypothetical protein
VTTQSEGRRQHGVQVGDVLDLTSAVIVVGLLTLIYEDRYGVPRILLALAFTFFVPGRVIVSNWPSLSRWSEASTAMVLSLVVLGLTATVSLWVHAWNPMVILGIEGWLCISGLCIGITRRHEFWRASVR